MWSDRETEQDCLGYLSYVAVLADATHEGIAPLTLGISVFAERAAGAARAVRLRGDLE